MAIPIIGQPKVGEDWFLTVPIHCPCGQYFLIAGQVGTTRACPGCMKLYRLVRLPVEHPVTGEITWALATLKPDAKEPGS